MEKEHDFRIPGIGKDMKNPFYLKCHPERSEGSYSLIGRIIIQATLCFITPSQKLIIKILPRPKARSEYGCIQIFLNQSIK